MECTKVNCPMQAGTPTDNCGEDCPWRTIAKTGDLISRAAVRDVINTWGRQKSEKIRMELLHRDLDALLTIDAIPVEWLNKNKTEYLDDWGENPVTVEQALKMWRKEQEART